MTRLRLVASGSEPGSAAGGLPAGAAEPALAPVRLPRGRHGLPPDLVRANQRQRLLEAAAAALAEQGYGRLTAARIIELAGVSSRTFYQHFEDLWSCVLAAYEIEAARLCAAIEGLCGDTHGGDAESAGRYGEAPRAGIAAALDFLASEPAVARLLSAEPPPQVAALLTARRGLIERLGAMLRTALEAGGATPLPELERRLVGAALALVAARASDGNPQRLLDLEPELSDLLLAAL